VESQRGFSLVEVVVASAVTFVVGSLLVWLAHATVFAASHSNARLTGIASAGRLAERLCADAAGAWSLFVPAADVFGAANSDGHELDFVSEDASHRTFWWAYRYDATAGRVTVYAYTPGSTAVAGDEFDGITSFASEMHPVTDVTSAASDAYDSLFSGATVTPVSVDYGWNAQASGGNRLERVRIAAAGADRTLLLSSGTAPTHFTVIVDYTPPP